MDAVDALAEGVVEIQIVVRVAQAAVPVADNIGHAGWYLAAKAVRLAATTR